VIIAVSMVPLAGAVLTKHISKQTEFAFKVGRREKFTYYYTLRGITMVNVAASSDDLLV
jgi:hypothetical protein